ncbi:hypothetical protein ACIO87_38115 [Streptomyces sp. NPDC087218]|uniref:hypothetical protein n=1 Tax=Streptomyces sp. NPDC087218 TaxID=3365769 RepID=UPI00382186D4
MKTHALTAQAFVVSAGNPVDETCLQWMESTLGPQKHITAVGGWSAVIHPFNQYLAGPHTDTAPPPRRPKQPERTASAPTSRRAAKPRAVP